MFSLSRKELMMLAEQEQELAVSIYMPLEHKRGESRQDAIVLSHLLKQAEQQLVRRGMASPAVQRLLAPARALAAGAAFWGMRGRGLALYITPRVFHYYDCPVRFQERALVARHLYIKPLIPLLYEPGAFYVLALSEHHVRLLQSTANDLTELPMGGMPERTHQAAPGTKSEAQYALHTAPAAGVSRPLLVSRAQGDRNENRKEQLRRLIALVERGVASALREQRAPLVLAGNERLIPLYREVNTYQSLEELYIAGNPDDLPTKTLYLLALAILQPHLQEPVQQALCRYHKLRATAHVTHALNEIVPAAYMGKIETLFLNDTASCWGAFHPETNTLTIRMEGDADGEELLNLMCVRTLRHQGQVYVLSSAEMPEDSVAAAILRY